MRQRPLLALVAVVALLAGACASGDSSGPAVAAGGTVSGKVVSFTDTTVTLGTMDGERVIALGDATEGRDNLVVGSEVTIEIQGPTVGPESVAVRIRPPAG